MARKEKKHKPKKRKTWYRPFTEGRPLSLDFFVRHAWFIIVSLILVLALIGQRYRNLTHMREINKLEKELAQAESEQINAKAKYMSLIRENEMRRLVTEHHLGLDYQDKPPYILNAE